MASSELLRFAGDVSINKVKITTQKGFGQDITAQVLTVQFYEDLFSPFITGSIIVKESLDLINLFPFIGEEYLELDITTPGLKNKINGIKGSYYIYKLSDRELLGDRSVIYQLHFVSVEAITDLNKKVSRTFGDKVSDLVKPFLTDKVFGLETKKKVYIEPTVSSIKYISNYWSPVKNIKWLIEHAVNANNTPNYVFFENRDGFYFISLEQLYQGNMYQEFTYDKYTRDVLPNGKDARNVNEDFKRITDISIPVAYDYMDRIRNGMLSSRQIMYDVTKKTYSVKNYNMFDKFPTQKHLNKYPINSDKAIFRANSTLINFTKDFGNFAGWEDVTNARSFQERLSTMKLAEANKLNITVPGRTDYTVGQKVGVVLNRIEPFSAKDKDTTDKMFSGYYLIAAINHYINKDQHECHMELIKESSQMNMNRNS
jgi:hypothetical protein